MSHRIRLFRRSPLDAGNIFVVVVGANVVALVVDFVVAVV